MTALLERLSTEAYLCRNEGEYEIECGPVCGIAAPPDPPPGT